METGEPLSTIRDRVQSANAYIGAAPIVEALRLDADVVITGRSTDTALTYAPLIHEHGWADDRLGPHRGGRRGRAHQRVRRPGHRREHPVRLVDVDLAALGYPIIEMAADGTFVVTKHAELGGRVTWATVSEQLVYEMGDPAEYITPDCVADFSTIRLNDLGENRVAVSGVRGRKRTGMLKVSIAYRDGWKATGSLVYAAPDAVEKAMRADGILRARLERLGLKYDEIRTEFVGAGACSGHAPDMLPEPIRTGLPEVELRVGVRSADRDAVERFTRELAPLILAGPPSVTGFAAGRPRVQEVMAYWPALIDREVVERSLAVEVSHV